MSVTKKDKIGLSAAVVIGLNAMIGVGIISVATSLSHSAGPAGILSYLISIVVVLCMGLSLGFMARHYPGDGWNYTYPYQWGGHMLGMVSAFSYLISVIIAMGFLTQQVGFYVYQVLPIASPTFISVIVLSLLTVCVYAGGEASSIVQYLIFGSVLTSLLITIITCWGHLDFALLHPFMPKGWTSVLLAAPSALFGFLGFESIASLHSIVKNPDHTVGRAAAIAIVTVGLLYLGLVIGILLSIPPDYFYMAGGNPTLDVLMRAAFPRFAFVANFVFVGVVFGILGTVHSMLWSASVLCNDVLQKVRNKTIQKLLLRPWWSTNVVLCGIAVAMLVSALCIHGDMLVNMTIFFTVPSYIFSIIALLFIKEEWYSGRNIVAILGLIGAGAMLFFATQILFDSFAKLL